MHTGPYWHHRVHPQFLTDITEYIHRALLILQGTPTGPYWHYSVHPQVLTDIIVCTYSSWLILQSTTPGPYWHYRGPTVMGLRLLLYQKNTWLRTVCCLQIIFQEIGNPSGGHGVLPFCMGKMWFKLAVTSSNQFLPVVAHDKWTV